MLGYCLDSNWGYSAGFFHKNKKFNITIIELTVCRQSKLAKFIGGQTSMKEA